MENKGITTAIIVIAVVIVGALAWWYYAQNPSTQTYNNQRGTQGTLILGITDAAASMGAISSVDTTISKIEVHSAGQGWVTISSNVKQYDLLALKAADATALLAKAEVSADSYDAIRLTVDKIIVVENGVQKEAKLPSGKLTINLLTTVNGGNTSTAVFDILADQSLHVTGSGKYIFTPVIQVETRQNATVSVDSENKVSINEGTVQTNGTVGMDFGGQMKTGFAVPTSAALDVVGNIIQVTTSAGGAASTAKIKADAAAKAAVEGGYLDTATAATLTNEGAVKVWQISGMKGLEMVNVMIDATTGAVITGSASSPQAGSTGSGQSGTGVKVEGSGNVQVQY